LIRTPRLDAPLNQQLDELFLKRAGDRGLLTDSQVGSLRDELNERRESEPDIAASELAVEKGWLGVEAALALLDAKPEDTIADLTARISEGELASLSPTDDDQPSLEPDSPDTQRFPNVHDVEIQPEDEQFDEVPRLVEPLYPSYAVSDNPSEDSHLEMELPPPEASSGDSIFDDSESKEVPSLETDDGGPSIVGERTPSSRFASADLLPPETELGDAGALEEIEIEESDLDDEEIIMPADEAGVPEAVLDEMDHGIADEIHSEAAEGFEQDIAAEVAGHGYMQPAALDSSDTFTGDQMRPRPKDTERMEGVGARRSDTERLQPVDSLKSDTETYSNKHRDPGRTSSDTSLDGLSSAGAEGYFGERESPPPQFAQRGGKGADMDFAAFGEDERAEEPSEETEETSVRMNDSAVNEVMAQADDSYFGPPADLTITPPEMLEDSIAPPKPMDEKTLFDSESLKGTPGEEQEADFVATAPPSANVQEPVSAEITDDSDIDVSVTLPGEFPADASTIIDESEFAIEDVTDESEVSEVTTGSRTAFATGEVARPGLRNRTDSKLGVESNITGDEVITGHEMTLADLRQQMGIGQGVKLGSPGGGALSRLKKTSKKKRYSVIREIARGGMGKVIEVEDNDLRRSVALKVLRKEMLDRSDLVERFLEEAQITGQLEHPNIVPVHEMGVDGAGNLYFTMKFVEGSSLSEVLLRLREGNRDTEREYPLLRLLDTFIKICEGMSFAHNRGVIHRDLKPANIMVGRFGEVQVMDWGVAKVVGRQFRSFDNDSGIVLTDRLDAGSVHTMMGSVIGTPSYMSPEQAKGDIDIINHKSDIFSLGVILYEMLCLRSPWTGKSSDEVLEQVREMTPMKPRERNPEAEIPAELERLALKCLEKDPEARIDTVKELAENVRSFIEGRAMGSVEYSPLRLAMKWVGRNRKEVIGALLALLIIAGSVFGTIWYIKKLDQDKILGLSDDAKILMAEWEPLAKDGKFQDAEAKVDDAKHLYQKVLVVDEEDPTALEGLQQVEQATDKIRALRTKADQKAALEEQRDALIADGRKSLKAGMADQLTGYHLMEEAYAKASAALALDKNSREAAQLLAEAANERAKVAVRLRRVNVLKFWIDRFSAVPNLSNAMKKELDERKFDLQRLGGSG